MRVFEEARDSTRLYGRAASMDSP